jgi:TetR/AcrR family transcriptional regulator
MARSPDLSSPSTRVRQRKQTREAVLDTAIDGFSEHGYEGTSLGHISSRCGIKQSLILYHFQSKEMLWRAAVDEVWRRMETTLFSFATQHGLILDRDGKFEGPVDEHGLRALLRAFLYSMAEHPAYLQILLREGSHAGARFAWLEKHHTRRNFRLCKDLIETAQTNGLIRQGSAEHWVYILAGAMTFIFAIEADVQKQTGLDPHDPDFLDAHIETLLAFLNNAG